MKNQIIRFNFSKILTDAFYLKKSFINFIYNVFFLNIDYNWVVTLNRSCLGLFGVWPEFNETPRRKLMMNVRVIVILNIIIWSSIIPSLHSLIRIWGNITSMIDNLQYTLPLSIAIMKLVLLWRKKKGIIKLERRNMYRKFKLIQNFIFSILQRIIKMRQI